MPSWTHTVGASSGITHLAALRVLWQPAHHGVQLAQLAQHGLHLGRQLLVFGELVLEHSFVAFPLVICLDHGVFSEATQGPQVELFSRNQRNGKISSAYS
jgi:hypothetical protein